MLVLTRKQQEKIQIGENIVITVLRTKGNTVRLGIEAPSDVSVLRGELVDRLNESGELNGPAKMSEPARTTTEALPATPGMQPAAATTRVAKAVAVDHTQRGRETWSKPTDSRVSLQRVDRSRVGSVLPTMLGEAGPLRAMLDRRTASVAS